MHDARKMLPFLSYLFDPSNLDDHCRDEWLKQYDAPFVDNVISRAEAWRDDADAYLEILERQVEDANASRSPGRPIREVRVDGSTSSGRDAGPRLNGVTVPEPFALHPGRPKPNPPPEPIVRAPKPKPAPTTRTGPTAEQIALAKTFAANREATAAKYADPRLAFRLRAVERPSNLEHVRETMAAERAAEEAASSRRVRAAPMPEYPPAPEVRLTAAAILREDAVYQRRRAEEAAALEAFEMNLRDASAYDRWRAEGRAKDEEDRAKRAEETKREMEAAFEAALRAREESRAAKAEKVAEAREASAEMRRRVEEDKAEDERLRKTRRDKVAEERVGAERAAEALLESRKKAAERRNAEKAEAALRLAEERAADRRRKAELVRQIRAVEAAPRAAPGAAERAADTSLAGGLMLLEDMSVAELRERLAIVRRRAKEEEETRRRHIVAKREERQTALREKLADVRAIRGVAAAQGSRRREANADAARRRAEEAARRAETVRRASEAKREAASSRREEIAKRAEVAKRAERFRLETASGASKESRVEAFRRDVAAGYRREDARRERDTRALAAFDAETRSTASRAAATRRRDARRAKTTYELEYERRLREAGAADETMRREDAERKREAYEAERARRRDVREKFTMRNVGLGPEKSGVGVGSLRRAGLTSTTRGAAFAKTGNGREYAMERPASPLGESTVARTLRLEQHA